ncbi:hypothetical protein [Streptomyces sp. SM12]|uniref:hypothetical protein n=1 Tax=Streptomyces sp. SM12 TaxID=1071602 RepID=UPI002156233B|nr:hypothetical protein [Streptomyces sp. SM12]
MSDLATSPSAAAAEQRPSFLLTVQQGDAARALLSYVASLPLPGPDARLLAVMIAIRAARGGAGNVIGSDVSSLRLDDSHAAVDALRGLSWQIDDGVFETGTQAPIVSVTVPDLAQEGERHPLPFGKGTRSRVSGWTMRARSVKPVKKLPPAGRLAALFLAAHSTTGGQVEIPQHLPGPCREALPELLEKNFVNEESGRLWLAAEVRHLSGRRPPTSAENGREPEPEPEPHQSRFRYDEAAWAAWKARATPALLRHVESVESCALCGRGVEQVASAFMLQSEPLRKSGRGAFRRWMAANPGADRAAAELTVTFRSEHGHGPSYGQLAQAMGWPPFWRSWIIDGLVVQRWLTTTGTTPWTLRPGPAAQRAGIVLPAARTAQQSRGATRSVVATA